MGLFLPPVTFCSFQAVRDLSSKPTSHPMATSLGLLESHTQAIKCSNLESTHSLLLTGQQEFPSLPSNKGAGKTWFAPSQSWLPTSCTIASLGTSEDGGNAACMCEEVADTANEETGHSVRLNFKQAANSFLESKHGVPRVSKAVAARGQTLVPRTSQ